MFPAAFQVTLDPQYLIESTELLKEATSAPLTLPDLFKINVIAKLLPRVKRKSFLLKGRCHVVIRIKLRLVFVLKELAAMIDKHRNENEKWIADCREELKEERRQLEQEKVLHNI